MAMTPFALSLLGVEQSSGQRRQRDVADGDAEVPTEVQPAPEVRPARPSRNRATSYYNAFQTVCSTANDEPPTYEYAARQRLPQRHPDYLRETLPGYSCSVEASAIVLLQLESMSPLHDPSESEWREAYLVVQGTLLSFYRAKEKGPGKLLRSYTLQHAEVGLALDTQHEVLVPQTRLARLVPSSARRKAMQKDPDMFRIVRQHSLRLRVETDQIVIAHASEEHIHGLVHAISAGIDIAQAIDERSLPRLCTVPRWRRRQRASQTGDITDPAVVAEQERILRDMYPAFAEQNPETRPSFERTVTNATQATIPTAQTPAREEDELDLAAIREDAAGTSDDPSRRPPMSRNVTSSTINSTYSADMLYATLPTNFTSAGKWAPPHSRTPSQIQRYIRRCMPILPADAVRASDILICHGQRVKINWRMELLEEWELQPPTYKSHHFNHSEDQEQDQTLDLTRTHSCSQNSASESTPNPHASTSDLGSDDHITRCDETETSTRLAPLDRSKSAVLDKGTSSATRQTSSPKPAAAPQRHHHPGQDVHGVVFCF
ncbi:uncharacterized protein LTR77_003420 [Saxophila tyrrhenica]|uniref:Uncharacterized protein n=1 Tax=Saxophila tyrrhenica TaxID=1690608 RepID=A0AAV9PEC4_9PEZI|nr:hypothetical protein LTR77_003420 [Saxophila tyrrhenica]